MNPGFFCHKIVILGLLGHAAFYEDETCSEIRLYADLHGNLSFIAIVSRPVTYVEYSITSKNIMSDGRHLLLLTQLLCLCSRFSATKLYFDGYGSPASNNQPLQSMPTIT